MELGKSPPKESGPTLLNEAWELSEVDFLKAGFTGFQSFTKPQCLLKNGLNGLFFFPAPTISLT